MNKNVSRTVQYGLISACFWMSFAVTMAFTSAYLLHNGFSNTIIGLLIALSGIASAVLQPLISSYADHEDSPSVKKLIIGLCAVVLVDAGVLSIFRLPKAVIGFCYCAALMLLQVLQPLVNALSMETVNQGYRLDFGVSRAIGSIGYAAAAYLMGLLISVKDADIIPRCILLSFGLLTVSTLVYPFRKQAIVKDKTDPVQENRGKGFFRKYPAFSVCLIGLVLIYFTHALINNYTLQIVTQKGGSEAQMGSATSLAAGLELLVMLGFSKISAKVSLRKLVKISGIFFTVKIFATWLAADIAGFYAVQVFQIFGWGIMAVALVCFVNEITEPCDHIKGQAYATTAYTIGVVLGSLLGGAVIDAAGIPAMLLMGTAVGAVGSVLIWFSADKCEKR